MRKPGAYTLPLIEMNLHIAHMFLESPTSTPLAENIVLQDLAQNCTYTNREMVYPLLRAFFGEGFSEVKIEKQTVLADENYAILEFVFSGCHRGTFFSIPPTGQRVKVPMVLVCQIANGRVQHVRWYYDAGTMLRQLGFAL